MACEMEWIWTRISRRTRNVSARVSRFDVLVVNNILYSPCRPCGPCPINRAPYVHSNPSSLCVHARTRSHLVQRHPWAGSKDGFRFAILRPWQLVVYCGLAVSAAGFIVASPSRPRLKFWASITTFEVAHSIQARRASNENRW
jgi:hypothetical protein